MLNSSWSDGKSSNNGFVKNLGVKVKKLAVCNVIASLVSFAKKA